MATRKAPKQASSATIAPPPAATAPLPAGVADPPRATIVGIGASAGGLEAYEKLFRHLPPVSGLAYVLVPHLDPAHASILTEILQRCTAMPVVEAQDQVLVAPDHVYVIPPNRDLAIFHGMLQLSVPELPRGQRMPIDAFLRSLAEDQGERAVGILLSGTGTDGTLGLRAIVGAGGVTLVQDPATAKYDGMPASAVKAGYAGHTVPVEAMPAILLSAVSHRVTAASQPDPPTVATQSAGGMNKVLLLLRSATGSDFSQYKKSTIGRRVERRMAQHGLTDIEVYARYLREHPAELKLLFRELLINVTSFFRDPDAFAALKQDILPQLLADKPDDYVLRIWTPGCSTGEEAYSIAMALREVMDESRHEFKVQIYATDLDDEAIRVARGGLYPPNVAADLTPERLRRFFVKDEAGYRIKKDIREMVVFAIQNVIKDPPFTRLDLVSCRNLMIYLEPELQNRLIPALHYALKPGGVLFLSPSESIGNHTSLFKPLNRKWKLYSAVGAPVPARAATTSDAPWGARDGGNDQGVVVTTAKEINFAELTRRTLLASWAPASVLVDASGTILFIHGETGKYLRPAPGQPTHNILDMAREGLQGELRAALQRAATPGNSTSEREVAVKTNGDFQAVRVSVRQLPDPGGHPGLLLLNFQDVVPAKAGAQRARGRRAGHAEPSTRVDELERDLAYTREHLQATIEGQQSANEELKSTNEELQSTNEELQSTNEELETSKEELQSINEELSTVNAELQAKIEQLADMQNDMKNLLDSVSIGIVFLDEQLRIRRFTRDATRVYRLVATDVGRALADIKSSLPGDDLIVAAQKVIESLVPCEHEVRADDGTCYLARVQPYRTLDNVIEGVVVTFTDITQRVAAGATERQALELAESIIATVRQPLLVLDADMKVVSANRSFCQQFRVEQGDAIGRALYTLRGGHWDIPELREMLESILPRNRSVDDFEVTHEFPDSGRCRMLFSARGLARADGQRPLILLAIEGACRPA